MGRKNLRAGQSHFELVLVLCFKYRILITIVEYLSICDPAVCLNLSIFKNSKL